MRIHNDQVNTIIANLTRNPAEYMPLEDVYSPSIHRTHQAIRRRAVRPDEPIEQPAEVLTKYSHPPEELVLRNASELAALIKAANVQKGQ